MHCSSRRYSTNNRFALAVSISVTASSSGGAKFNGFPSSIPAHRRWLSSTCRTRSVCRTCLRSTDGARDRTDHQRPGGSGSRPGRTLDLGAAHQYVGRWRQRLGSVFLTCRPESRRKEKDGRHSCARKPEGWDDLIVHEDDPVVIKNRLRAFAHGSFNFERVLLCQGIDTILVGGAKTNVRCDPTARNAMMLDFKSVTVSDCCETPSDDEHLASLETFIQQYVEVMTSNDVMDRMLGRSDTAVAE